MLRLLDATRVRVVRQVLSYHFQARRVNHSVRTVLKGATVHLRGVPSVHHVKREAIKSFRGKFRVRTATKDPSTQRLARDELRLA